MTATLLYDSKSGKHTSFDKYWMSTIGIITNKDSGEAPSYSKSGNYNVVNVMDNDGKVRRIYVGRAVASTFLGPPPTLKHTADHIDRDQPDNDALTNIRWLDKSGQRANQKRPETLKTAFVVVKDGLEKTLKEWVEHFDGEKNLLDRKYTNGMIKQYAIRKQHGFSYKEYPNLDGEVWKSVEGSENTQGRWEVSDMKRVKYVTNHANNVLWGDRLRLNVGYPTVNINGKNVGCHVLAFKTFYPDLWAAKKDDEGVLHKFDDKLDFRPHMLRLGTQSDNAEDAHANNKYAGKKTERTICISYVSGVFEKEHESQEDAAKYLRKNGCPNASKSAICIALMAFKNGETKKRYDCTWEIPAAIPDKSSPTYEFRPAPIHEFEAKKFSCITTGSSTIFMR
jgi:hypothetical protein